VEKQAQYIGKHTSELDQISHQLGPYIFVSHQFVIERVKIGPNNSFQREPHFKFSFPPHHCICTSFRKIDVHTTH
jgi:hypothetical protein